MHWKFGGRILLHRIIDWKRGNALHGWSSLSRPALQAGSGFQVETTRRHKEDKTPSTSLVVTNSQDTPVHFLQTLMHSRPFLHPSVSVGQVHQFTPESRYRNCIMKMGFARSYRSYHGIVGINLQEKFEGNPDNMANMASQPDLALVTLAGPMRKPQQHE